MPETINAETINKIDLMWFDGPCPFLLRLETVAHFHPVCPVCRAVRFGNISCDYCREQVKITEILEAGASVGQR